MYRLYRNYPQNIVSNKKNILKGEDGVKITTKCIENIEMLDLQRVIVLGGHISKGE